MPNSTKALPQQTAYSANVTKGLLAKTLVIANSLTALLVINKDNDNFKFIGIDNRIVILVGELEHIPTFLHPIIHNKKAFIDARGYFNKDGGIRNYYEYVLLVRRALLDLAWVTDKDSFLGQLNFTIDTFSSWFSYGLQRHTNATLLTATNYRIIAAIYYLGLFSDGDIYKSSDVTDYILKKIPRIIAIPAQTVNDLITINEEVVVALFRNGRDLSENRLTQLSEILTILTNEVFTIDAGIIYNSLCRGAFIAANAIEIASIAIEHPPTLLAMMSCVTQKGLQNNTGLGRAVAGIMRKHDIADFNRFINEISPMAG